GPRCRSFCSSSSQPSSSVNGFRPRCATRSSDIVRFAIQTPTKYGTGSAGAMSVKQRSSARQGTDPPRGGGGVMTVRWSMRPGTFDRMMRGSNQRRYYGDSGYFNFGYWGAGAKSQREASEALVDQMVARIAAKTGRILDVACGLGGSTKR